MKIILASASARRQELIRERYSDVVIDPPQGQEQVDIHGDPRLEAMHCAMVKGLEVEPRHDDGILIACDTMVYLNCLIGKPKDRADAFEIISRLAGRTHQVITGVYVVNLSTGAKLIDYEISEVTFKNLAVADIWRYLDRADVMDKAGAYAIQEEGRDLVEEIRGEVNNVIGLPTEKLARMIEQVTRSD